MKILLILCTVAALAPAQTFEVAAIHPNTAGGVPLIKAMPVGLLSATNTSLQTLIRVAYRVGVPQISGPDWMSSVHFDISARGAPEDVSLAVTAPKIKALLTERFGLVAHEASAMESAIVLSHGEDIVPSEGGDAVLHMSRTSMIGKNIAMGELCRGLSDATGELYVDESGFAGRFDVNIVWSRVQAEPALAVNAPPSLNTVLHEQLGLEVRSKKVAVVRLVVDRVNRAPTDN
jgi:uncharacterized protein (TIGR03435 family)